MKLISVNVSLPKTVYHQGRRVNTGIYNEPVTGRVMVRKLNVDGDGQADLKVHGGVYKAVYIYDIENIRYWRKVLGRYDLTYGHFGENFTVEGMPDDRIQIGDVFRIGGALLEVTQGRGGSWRRRFHRANPSRTGKNNGGGIRPALLLRYPQPGKDSADFTHPIDTPRMEPRFRKAPGDLRRKGEKTQDAGKGMAGIPTFHRLPEGAGKPDHHLLLSGAGRR
jgi:hypothetical protein